MTAVSASDDMFGMVQTNTEVDDDATSKSSLADTVYVPMSQESSGNECQMVFTCPAETRQRVLSSISSTPTSLSSAAIEVKTYMDWSRMTMVRLHPNGTIEDPTQMLRGSEGFQIHRFADGTDVATEIPNLVVEASTETVFKKPAGKHIKKPAANIPELPESPVGMKRPASSRSNIVPQPDSADPGSGNHAADHGGGDQEASHEPDLGEASEPKVLSAKKCVLFVLCVVVDNYVAMPGLRQNAVPHLSMGFPAEVWGEEAGLPSREQICCTSSYG